METECTMLVENCTVCSLPSTVCSLQKSYTAFQPQLSRTEAFQRIVEISTEENTMAIDHDATLLIPLTIPTSLREEKQNNANNKIAVHLEGSSPCLLIISSVH